MEDFDSVSFETEAAQLPIEHQLTFSLKFDCINIFGFVRSISNSYFLVICREVTRRLILSSSEGGGRVSIYFRRHMYLFQYMRSKFLL